MESSPKLSIVNDLFLSTTSANAAAPLETNCTGSETNCTGSEANCTGSEANCTGSEANCTGSETNCTGSEANCTGSVANCTGSETNCTGNASCPGNGTRCEQVVLCFLQFCRPDTHKSQYRSYLDYIRLVGETMGFVVEEDMLRIPSSKRVGIKFRSHILRFHSI